MRDISSNLSFVKVQNFSSSNITHFSSIRSNWVISLLSFGPSIKYKFCHSGMPMGLPSSNSKKKKL